MSVRQTQEGQLHALFGLTSSQLDKVMAAAMNGRQQDGRYCDIYLQAGAEQGLTWDQGTLKGTASSILNGAGVRVVIGDKTGYSYTDHVNFTNLRRAAAAARAIADHSRDTKPHRADSTICGAGTPHDLYAIAQAPVAVALQEKIALLRAIDEAARAYDSRIQNVTINLGIEEHSIIIATSFGEVVIDKRPLIRLHVSCLAVDGKRRETSTSGGGGRYEFGRLLQDEMWRMHALSAAQQAVALLSADPAPAGEMTVVLGSGWPGVLIHEAVGHGLEADFNRKGTSAFSRLIGQQVASTLCTVIDDGTIAYRRGSLNVDDEGTPTGRTVLIENGILKGYMQDRLNATLMGARLTGNGRRENYRFAPMPRMTNTFLAGGQSTPEEIIASVKYGLYATNFGGGQVDITNGNFTFSATGACLIEDGKLTRPVKGATLIGNGPKALHRVSMVGNDLALDKGIGTCGKNGQGVPVGVGLPTIRIDAVTVGGTRG